MPRVPIGRRGSAAGSGNSSSKLPTSDAAQPLIWLGGITWSAIASVPVLATPSIVFAWTAWKLLASQALSGPAGALSRIVEGGADYWIMWRRVGGGLNASLQQALFERLRAYLLPGKGKSMPKPGSNELAEMWRAVASLERLDSRHKQALGQVLLKSARAAQRPRMSFGR